MDDDDLALVSGLRLAVRDRLTAPGSSPPEDELATMFLYLLELARDRGATPVQRAALGALVIELEGLGSLALATTTAHPIIARTVTLAGTRVCRGIVELALELLGPDAQLTRPNAPYDGLWPDLELATRSALVTAALDGPLVAAVTAVCGDLAAAADHVTDVQLGTAAAAAGDIRASVRARLSGEVLPAWDEMAAEGWSGLSAPPEIGGRGLDFGVEAVVLEELARCAAPGPYFSTIGVLRPALEGDMLARVVAGEASWTLALAPLVPDLDTTTDVAIVGGDGIWQLEGGERELLETSDGTRPLGVVLGGNAGARISSSTLLPVIRTRTLAALAAEACGVGYRLLELAAARGAAVGDVASSLLLARALAYRAAALVSTRDEGAGPVAAAAKVKAVDAALAASARAGPDGEADRLARRARWLSAWEASGATLRVELAVSLLDLNEG